MQDKSDELNYRYLRGSIFSRTVMLSHLRGELKLRRTPKKTQKSMEHLDRGSKIISIQQIDQWERMISILQKEPEIRTCSENDFVIHQLSTDFKYFQDLLKDGRSDLLLKVCRVLRLKFITEGTPIIRIGTFGDQFYIVLKGRAGVYSINNNPDSQIQSEIPKEYEIKEEYKAGLKLFTELDQGESFGQLTLIEKKSRRDSVIAHTDMYLGIVNKADFEEILKEYEREKMRKAASFLERIAPFNSWDGRRQIKLHLNSTKIIYNLNDVVYAEGSEPIAFYIVLWGSFEVRQKRKQCNFEQLDSELEQECEPEFPLKSEIISPKEMKIQRKKDFHEVDNILKIGLKGVKSSRSELNTIRIANIPENNFFGEEEIIYGVNERCFSVVCASASASLFVIPRKEFEQALIYDISSIEFFTQLAEEKKKQRQQQVEKDKATQQQRNLIRFSEKKNNLLQLNNFVIDSNGQSSLKSKEIKIKTNPGNTINQQQKIKGTESGQDESFEETNIFQFERMRKDKKYKSRCLLQKMLGSNKESSDQVDITNSGQQTTSSIQSIRMIKQETTIQQNQQTGVINSNNAKSDSIEKINNETYQNGRNTHNRCSILQNYADNIKSCLIERFKGEKMDIRLIKQHLRRNTQSQISLSNIPQKQKDQIENLKLKINSLENLESLNNQEGSNLFKRNSILEEKNQEIKPRIGPSIQISRRSNILNKSFRSNNLSEGFSQNNNENDFSFLTKKHQTHFRFFSFITDQSQDKIKMNQSEIDKGFREQSNNPFFQALSVNKKSLTSNHQRNTNPFIEETLDINTRILNKMNNLLGAINKQGKRPNHQSMDLSETSQLQKQIDQSLSIDQNSISTQCTKNEFNFKKEIKQKVNESSHSFEQYIKKRGFSPSKILSKSDYNNKIPFSQASIWSNRRL